MALPYSYQHLQSQPVYFNANNLPMPRLSYIPPSVLNFYPLIVQTLIEVINNKAQTNILRTFLYNQMSDNFFNNSNFASLVEYTVRLLDMRLAINRFPDMNKAILHVAETTLEQRAAINVSEYQELATILDPYTLNNVNIKVQEAARVSSELRNYELNVAQSNQVGLSYNAGVQQHMQQQNVVYRSNNYVSNNPIHQQVSTGSVYSTTQNTNNDIGRFSRFSNNVNNQSNTQVNNIDPQLVVQNTPNLFARYNYNVKPNANDLVLAQNLKQSSVEEKTSNDKITWVPSITHPFAYAYDPNQYTYRYVKENGIVVQKLTKLERDKMDINQHFEDTKLSDQRLSQVSENVTKERVMQTESAIDENELYPIISLGGDTRSSQVDMSMNDVKYMSDIGLATMAINNNKVNIFRKAGILVQPLVSTLKIDDFVSGLMILDTFSSVATALQDAESCIKHGHSVNIDRASLLEIDRRLTKSVNHFINLELGLKYGFIESFIEDVGGLLDWHLKRHGDVIHDCLCNNQSNIIKRALVLANDELKESLDNDYFNNISNKPTSIYFLDFYTIIATDLFYNELSLAIPESNISVGVFEKATPFFYKLVDKLLSLAKQDDQLNYNHYIKTKDGLMLEVLTGALNPDFYLVAKTNL